MVPSYVVRPGDTHSAVAQANFGDPNRYHDIVRANPLAIADPNFIFVGQELKIPIGT